MESFFRLFATSAHGINAQSARLRVTAENIANADTPGYHRKILPFEAVATEAGGTLVVPGSVTFGTEPLQRIHDPSHPLAGPDGSYDGSNVELMIEIGDAREAQRSYEANLQMFEQARQMAQSYLDLLRR